MLDGVPPSLTNHVLHCHAHAVLPAAVDGSTVLAAVRCVSSGKTWINWNALDAGPRENGADLHLTYRQMTVLRLIYEGLSNKEISGRIGVSSSSIKASISNCSRESEYVRAHSWYAGITMLSGSLIAFVAEALLTSGSVVRTGAEATAAAEPGVGSDTEEGEAALAPNSSGVQILCANGGLPRTLVRCRVFTTPEICAGAWERGSPSASLVMPEMATPASIPNDSGWRRKS